MRTLLHDLGASEIVIVSRRKATALALPEAPETAASHSVLMKTQADSGSASGIEKAPADSGCASTASETSKSDSFGTHEEIPVTMTDYEHVRIDHADAQIIINTTPVGMTPGNGRTPLDLTSFKDLCGVADVIYNPLRTAFIMQAVLTFRSWFPMGCGVRRMTWPVSTGTPGLPFVPRRTCGLLPAGADFLILPIGCNSASVQTVLPARGR